MSRFEDRARELVATIVEQHADAVDREARFPMEAIAALKSGGFLGAMVPREFGGDGADLKEILSFCHLLGQACASTAMIYAMHQIQVACVIRHGSQSEWHRRLLERLATEQLLLASATSEATIGGDVRSSLCAVNQVGSSFTLQKNATVISYGQYADGILATARREPGSPPSDQVLVVLLADDFQIKRTSEWDGLGMRGTCSEGFLLDATGSVEQILPVPYADISAETMLPFSHLAWCSTWVGIATSAMTRARAFVRAEARKKPGTTPPGARRLADAVAQLQLMRAAVEAAWRDYAAALASTGGPTSLGFAIAMNNLKTSISQAAIQIVDQAMLVCGISGYRNDGQYSLGRHLRDIHSAAVMVNNDRVLGNTANLLLVYKQEMGLFE